MRLQLETSDEDEEPSETNDTTANKETEETNWNSLTRSETDPHNSRNCRPKGRRKHIAAP